MEIDNSKVVSGTIKTIIFYVLFFYLMPNTVSHFLSVNDPYFMEQRMYIPS